MIRFTREITTSTVAALLLFILNGCCITRAQDRFGIKDVSPTDLQKAVLYNGTDLYLETKTDVQWGRSYAAYPSSDTIKMKCRFAAESENVTDEVNNQRYRKGDGSLHWFFSTLTQIDQVNYVKDTSCSEIEDDAVLAGEILNIFTDKDRFAGKQPSTPFIYIEGANRYYPTRNYVVLGKDKKYTYMRIEYIQTKRVETAARHFRFLVYPFTVALDFITFPLQVLTYDHHGCFNACPRWTCGNN